MTKDEERECYLFGSNLALHCIDPANDNNKDFYESLKSLNKNEKNLVLAELIFFRSSFIGTKLFSGIKNNEKRNMKLVYFFTKLSDELDMDISSVYEKSRKYAEFTIDYLETEKKNDMIFPHLILKNSGIDIEKIIGDGYSKFSIEYFMPNITMFWIGVQNIFKVYSKDLNKKSGCLGSVLTLIFVICFLIYVI